jgi:hypothetical protein
MEVWWILGGIVVVALASWWLFKLEVDETIIPHERVTLQMAPLLLMMLGAIVCTFAGLSALGWLS